MIGSWLVRGSLNFEWWVGRWQYSGATTLLLWVPHQALGAWLATTLARDDGPEGTAALVGAALLLWSPFAALGLAPLLLPALVEGPRRFLTAANLVAAPALALVLGAFLAARTAPLGAASSRSRSRSSRRSPSSGQGS